MSAAVSQPVPKASCGPPPDWAMSGVSSHRRCGRIAECGWGFEAFEAFPVVGCVLMRGSCVSAEAL